MDYLEQDKDSDNDALAMLTLLYSAKEVRRAKWQHERINWEQTETYKWISEAISHVRAVV